MLRRILFLVLFLLGGALIACTDDDSASRLAELEARLTELTGELAATSNTVALGEAVSDHGLVLRVRRVWVESSPITDDLRLAAEVELDNDTDDLRRNRFYLAARTPDGETLTFINCCDDRNLSSWDFVPGGASLKGYVYATSWLDSPLDWEAAKDDLLSISEVVIAVVGSPRLVRVQAVPERGTLVSPEPSRDSEPAVTSEFWSTFVNGTDIVWFFPAAAFTRLALILSVNQTGFDSGHPQAVACAKWILVGEGSPLDCNLTRVE